MEAQEENAPAWLVTLGITDWQMEMEILNAIETRQKQGSDQQQYQRADEHRQAEGSGSSDQHARGRQA